MSGGASHNVRVLPGGAGDEVRDANGTARYSLADVIHFKYPDPRDPYGPGPSPLKATFENAAQASQYTAFRAALVIVPCSRTKARMRSSSVGRSPRKRGGDRASEPVRGPRDVRDGDGA